MEIHSGCLGSVGPLWLPSERDSGWGSALQSPSHALQPPLPLTLLAVIPQKTQTTREGMMKRKELAVMNRDGLLTPEGL